MSEKAIHILIVEDDDYRIRWFRQVSIGMVLHITKDVEEAKRWIDERHFDQIFLDHDLSEEHYKVWEQGIADYDATTGYAVANHLAENPDRSPNAQIIVHSLNPTGGRRMADRLKDTRKNIFHVPFGRLVDEIRLI